MGWERRGHKLYYYRSKWVNGRVVREYCGTGAEGEAAALEEAETILKDFRAREELVEHKRELAEMLALDDKLEAQIAELMEAAGFHKYRGVWRKKRKPREQAKAGGQAGGRPKSDEGHA